MKQGKLAVSATKVARLMKVEGFHRLGGHPPGLILNTRGGRASWVLRFTLDGKTRDMGLGSCADVSYVQARELARAQRTLLLQKIDPLESRHQTAVARKVASAKVRTFGQCVEQYLQAHSPKWSSLQHQYQWRQTLDVACQVLGQLDVRHVDTALVVQVLEPLWHTKTETASRLRGRIENVLAWATVHGYRSGENPARWRGHLDQLLAAPSKISKTVHHGALPYAEVAAFLSQLRSQRSVGARALEFLILVAARSGEVLGARWSEIDLQGRVWTVPAQRMKARRTHRVPLSAPVIALLEHMKAQAIDEYVFPSPRGGAMSNMALTGLLRRMDRHDIVPHGFRSTFKTWAAEISHAPRELAEAALAHAVGNAVEQSYQRGDLLEKRRRLMEDWARWCDRPAQSSVVTLKSGGRHGLV